MMGTKRTLRSLVPLALLLTVLFALGACQAMFTYTPLTSFQRSPATMTPAEQITYAQDALASGDKAAMTTAYDAIKDQTGATASYTAAQLAVEISGVPELIVSAISDPSVISGGATDVNSYLAAHPDIQPAYLIAAAQKLDSVPKSDLTPMDYVYGGLGLVLDAATQANGTIDVTNLNATKLAAAQTFINYALDPANNVITSASSSDPVYALLSYVNGL